MENINQIFKIVGQNIRFRFVLNYLSLNGNFLFKILTVGIVLLGIYLLIILLLKIFLLRQRINKKYTVLEVKPLQVTEQSQYTTLQLFNLIHSLAKQEPLIDKILNNGKYYSFEIVSTKDEGIRYLIRVNEKDSELLKRSLFSYLPGISVKETNDYLSKSILNNKSLAVTNFKLSNHFAYPLKKQKLLEEHDPIAYITGNMTKINPGELVAFQIVSSPLNKQYAGDIKKIKEMIYNDSDLRSGIDDGKRGFSLLTVFKVFVFVLLHILILPVGILVFVATGGDQGPFLSLKFNNKNKKIGNVYQEELEKLVKEKLDQQLFTTSLRLLVISNNKTELERRKDGFISSVSSFSNLGYQSLISFFNVKLNLIQKVKTYFFKQRILGVLGQSVLSSSEIADIYHLPFTSTTKTEDLVKIYSRQLPAPLSVKNNTAFDVVFGKNTYADVDTHIGLTDDDRSRHVYIIGQTGSGKSTVMFHMAKDDIKKGRGVAVIDPHGDLAEDLLTTVPDSRINDCIYFNPFDLRYPIGINLLELTPGLEDEELEQEKELVCESVISIFRRVFSKDENTDAHRIEYILRNAIYTAFTVKDATIFTVYDLLNDPEFQKNVTANLEDENLRNFWKNEFGRAGNFQVVKMVSGVTARIGRFLFSPTAKRILEQPRSTINFDDILRSGKILICNLAEGKLGEDTSQLLGTTVIAKLQQAVMRRARTVKNDRTPFYLFIDEFQNFATSSFSKLLSGGRKFGLRLTIAEQSTSQQEDRNVVNVILANTGTVICFRTASPIDEELMLSQFAPSVAQGDIVNLPRYRFYIKLSAIEPEEPFSGETLPMAVTKNPDNIQRIIDASRKNWAIEYQKPMSKPKVAVVQNKKNEKNTMAADDISTIF